nr:class I tRNA ligase family protein [Gammaproteobacteria bacterium]
AACRLSDVALLLYKTFKDVFCNKYLELIKPVGTMSQETMEATVSLFEAQIQALHPFMPFITEEAWHMLRTRSPRDYITISQYPTAQEVNQTHLDTMALLFAVVSSLKAALKIANPKVDVHIMVEDEERAALYTTYGFVIEKLIKGKVVLNTPPENGLRFMANKDICYALVKGSNEAETKEKLSHELQYLRKFLISVEKKLQNSAFIGRAPKEVITREESKKSDALAKIAVLEQQLNEQKP